MSSLGRIWPPSWMRIGIVVSLVGAYNLLAVAYATVSTARWMSDLNGSPFHRALAVVGPDPYLFHAWAGYCVPLAVGGALVLLGRSDRFGYLTTGERGGSRGRTALAAVTGLAGTAFLLPVVVLPALSLVRLLLGRRPVIHDGAWFLGLLVVGSLLLAGTRVLVADRG